MQRTLLLFSAFLLGASAVGAQEPRETQYFEPSAAKARFTFRWDFLARYDEILHLRVRPDIERGRFEVRPEAGLEVSDRFRLGVRAVADLGTDDNPQNAINFDNYRSRGVSLDRWYAEARPGRFVVRAGSFGMPLAASEMLWDRDVQTPGLAISWEALAGGPTSLVLSAAAFRGPQRERDRTRIAAGQVVFRAGEEARFAIEASAAYWNFEPENLASHLVRQNYFVAKPDGGRDLISRYRLVDLLIRARFPVLRVPVTASLDAIRNLGTRGVARDDRDALEGTVAFGRAGTPGQWRLFYTYQYVERDAVLGAYNTDDWWFHSWYRGSRSGIAYTLLPGVFVQGTATFQRRLDRKGTLSRLTFEVVKLF